MITGGIDREISHEAHYLTKKLLQMKALFPMDKPPNPEGVRRFAKCLKKRLTEQRSTLTFMTIRNRWAWEATVEFLNYHGLGEYAQDVVNFHTNVLRLRNENA